MMHPRELFELLVAKKDLTAEQMKTVITACMTGGYSDTQLAVFLALMRMKGETVEELTSAAQTMLEFSSPINLGTDLIDIVGTGGDGQNTFNISTLSSFIVAAAGTKVAKHGNRGVSSCSGSADVLEQAGFNLTLDEYGLQKCLNKHNLAFLFAPQHHPAISHARVARQQLGIRTFFNLLGPLMNPARAMRQVVGVCQAEWQQPIATVLANLGSTRCLVIHSLDGLDEISICAPTRVIEYHQGTYQEWIIKPEDYNLSHPSLMPIIVSSAAQSLKLIQAVLHGEQGAARDIAVLNAAAALYCAQTATNLPDAVKIAQETIDNGTALDCFTQLQQQTRTLMREQTHE